MGPLGKNTSRNWKEFRTSNYRATQSVCVCIYMYTHACLHFTKILIKICLRFKVFSPLGLFFFFFSCLFTFWKIFSPSVMHIIRVSSTYWVRCSLRSPFQILKSDSSRIRSDVLPKNIQSPRSKGHGVQILLLRKQPSVWKEKFPEK